MISLVKNLKCISRLNIHYYPNRRYKSYITSLKAVIAGKSLISAGLDIDRILHFVFYDKILQIYRQHWVRKFTDTFCQNTNKFNKKGRCYIPTPPLSARHALACINSYVVWFGNISRCTDLVRLLVNNYK